MEGKKLATTLDMSRKCQHSLLRDVVVRYRAQATVNSIQNCRLPESNLLLSLRMGPYIFIDASPVACNISEAIFYKIRVIRGISTHFVLFSSSSFQW